MTLTWHPHPNNEDGAIAVFACDYTDGEHMCTSISIYSTTDHVTAIELATHDGWRVASDLGAPDLCPDHPANPWTDEGATVATQFTAAGERFIAEQLAAAQVIQFGPKVGHLRVRSPKGTLWDIELERLHELDDLEVGKNITGTNCFAMLVPTFRGVVIPPAYRGGPQSLAWEAGVEAALDAPTDPLAHIGR